MGSRRKPSIEYSILYTATLCMLAAGAVMVYSASSAESLLAGSGDPSQYLKRYVMFGLVGLVVLHLASRHGLRVIKALTPMLLMASFALTVLVMMPGFGVTVNGATRWLGAGPVQFQPSELLKLSLILYAAMLLSSRPSCVKSIGTLVKPLLLGDRRGLPAAPEAAGHGHRDGDLPGHGRAPRGGGHADAAPGA